jgi:hypothetical protein
VGKLDSVDEVWTSRRSKKMHHNTFHALWKRAMWGMDKKGIQMIKRLFPDKPEPKRIVWSDFSDTLIIYW